MSFFDKIKREFSKTANTISSVFHGFSELDDDFYDELEESLILSDVGVSAATEAVEQLKDCARREKIKTTEDAKLRFQQILAEMLTDGGDGLDVSHSPTVILVIGVNGVGKTTTIGKLAQRFHAQGKKVLLCAADTFRAAAADQLEIWSQRAGVDIIRQNEGADPASVVYDALMATKAKKYDIVLCDTAGRLHNKTNLMNELAKISRIIDREMPDAHRETLLVLDGTTGQNGLIQAKQFGETAGVTGLILTKLDGTAKGGIVISVSRELQLPVRFIGVGETAEDLLPFEAESFVKALL